MNVNMDMDMDWHIGENIAVSAGCDDSGLRSSKAVFCRTSMEGAW